MVGVTDMPRCSISTAVQPDHRPQIGGFIYLLSCVAAVSAFLFGYDTGIVSAAMLYLRKDESMRMNSHVWQEIVVSIAPGFAGVGAVIAAPSADHFGRRILLMVSTVIFFVGGLICGVAMDRYVLTFGRTLLGIGIGIASMLAPIYISECSPHYIRGKMITCFQLMITFGLMAANIIGGLFSYIDPVNVGWRLMLGFASVPAAIQFVGLFFLPESPRWLFKHRTPKEAIAVLTQIYNGDEAWIKFEADDIQQTQAAQAKDIAVHGGNKLLLWRILKTSHIRRALLIGCALQMFMQLSGINTIMYYTGTIIRAAGIKDDRMSIWISVGTSGVNFFCTFLPFVLIEKAGRRKILLSSVLGVIISLCLMSGSFFLINTSSAAIVPTNTDSLNSTAAKHCASYRNCDRCVTSDLCGFCGMSDANGKQGAGYCLPISPSGMEAEEGICAGSSPNDTFYSPDGSAYTWADVSCQTPWTLAPIFIILIYLVSYSCGLGPIPWVVNAEFYPLWARGTCVAIATAVNWFFNLIVSLTFLTLTDTITKSGTFLFYAAMTTVGLVMMYFTVPETRHKNLSDIEFMFMSSRAQQRIMNVVDQQNAEIEKEKKSVSFDNNNS